MLNFLANYGRLESEDKSSKVRTATTVGVVGLPNTGKSSIINTLKRNKSCQVGATPGVTRSLQTVQIDSHVKLIDSPGVVLESKDRDSIVGKVLLHALDVGSVENSREAALEILKRCGDLEKLAFHYQLELDTKIIGNNPEHFLACLARRKGWLKKGARPDTNQACRFLLKQWTCGNLNFHTLPPTTTSNNDSKAVAASDGMSTETENETIPSSMSKYGASIKKFLGDELDTELLLKSNDDEDQDQDGMDQNDIKKTETTILFKPITVGSSGSNSIEYKVDLKNSGSRKRKVNFTTEENGMDDEEQTEKNLEHLGDTPKDDEFTAMFSEKKKKRMLKKRKKMLAKSNLEMEPVTDDLANMMEGI